MENKKISLRLMVKQNEIHKFDIVLNSDVIDTLKKTEYITEMIYEIDLSKGNYNLTLFRLRRYNK